MKWVRKIVFWAHLVTGLGVGLIVLIMSVTGVLLTYQRQITAWADTRGLAAGPPSPDAQRLPLEDLVATLEAVVGERPSSIRWHADPDRPAEAAFGRQRTLFINAYTGEILGEGNAAVREFFRVMVSWHRWLGAEGESRAVGRAITGASNLGFLFLVVSGFYLWWPRNWTLKAFRNVLLFRRGLSGKARDFNWHNVIGFWSLIPLTIVVASAVVISYPWASDLVYRLAGDSPPQASARGPGAGRSGTGQGGVRDGRARISAPVSLEGLGSLVGRAGALERDWRTITVQLSSVTPEAVSFTFDRGDGGQPHKRFELTLDRATGEVVTRSDFVDASPGRKLRSILRFAHTGEVAGVAGQTVAGLVSAGAAVLVWTGFWLAWRRFLAWRRRTSAVATVRSSREETREVAGAV